MRDGTLTPSAAVDVCLFDPAEKWCYEAKAGFNESSNARWHDTILTGRLKTTIVGGRVAFGHGRIL